MRIFCFAVLFLQLYGFSGAAVAEETIGLKEQFEQKISQLAGVPVSVADYSLKYATVYLRGIKIGDPARPELPSAKIKELSASCDFMSLLGGNLVLKEINIASFSGRLNLDANGHPVFGNIPVPDPVSLSTDSAELPFEKILGKDLKINIFDERTGRTAVLQLPSASISKTATAGEMLVDFTSTLAIADKGKALSGLEVAEVRGSVLLDHRHLETTDLTAKWGASVVKLSGRVDDLKALKMSLKYVVQPLDLTDAGRFLLPADGYTLHGVGRADGSVTGIPAKAVITGAVKFPSCRIVAPISATNKSAFIFPFQNLVASFSYLGRKLSIESAQAGLFGGILSGRGSVHPGKVPISFSINAKGQGIKAEAFLAQNTSQKQVVSGPVNATFQADGNVTGLATWNGRGTIAMQTGKYQAPPVITPVLSLVNLKEFASGDIQEANGTFVLNGGIMTTEDLYCLSSAGKAYYRGDVGLDTSLKGQLNLIFFQAAVARSQALQQISLDGKSASIPTRVEGTLLAPSFPGFSSGKLLELGLKRTGQKMLQDILQGKKTSGKTGDDKSPGDSGKDLIQDLQNIFKKKKQPAASPVTAPDSSQSPAPAKKEDLLRNELKKLLKF